MDSLLASHRTYLKSSQTRMAELEARVMHRLSQEVSSPSTESLGLESPVHFMDEAQSSTDYFNSKPFSFPTPQQYPESPALTFEQSIASSTTRPKVLLVDDDPVARKLSYKFLERYGCNIDVAVDGVEALNKVNATKYDLVLMVSLLQITIGMNMLTVESRTLLCPSLMVFQRRQSSVGLTSQHQLSA